MIDSLIGLLQSPDVDVDDFAHSNLSHIRDTSQSVYDTRYCLGLLGARILTVIGISLVKG